MTLIHLQKDQFRPPPDSTSYTCFNRISCTADTLEGDVTLELNISYGTDDQRRKSVLTEDGQIQRTKYFFGDYEEITENGTTKKYYYINSPSGLCGIFVKGSQNDTLWNAYTDHLGSLIYLVNADNANEYFDFSYNAWGNPREADDWTAPLSGSLFAQRGFTGHEHLVDFGLINMNGRVYDPALGRFLSPDPFVQDPLNSQNFNRYSYCYNNPLVYTDPDGELAWFVPIIIGAILYGGGNVAVHASQGDIDNFWEGLGYFAQGAVSGAIVGATWSFGLASLSGTGLLGGGTIIQGMNFASQGFAQYAGWAILSGKAVNTLSTITSLCNNSENAGKILLGKTYTDENNFWHGLTQSITRYTWEGLQTWTGYNFSQFRNTFGGVDRVDYLGGATFVTGENREYRQGVSLGNYPNIWLWDEIEGNFEERATSDPLFMHEYGHTFDSQWFGPLYLPVIGIPSVSGAEWTEKRANRNAERYFKKHYGVDWTPFLTLYPLK